MIQAPAGISLAKRSVQLCTAKETMRARTLGLKQVLLESDCTSNHACMSCISKLASAREIHRQGNFANTSEIAMGNDLGKALQGAADAVNSGQNAGQNAGQNSSQAHAFPPTPGWVGGGVPPPPMPPPQHIPPPVPPVVPNPSTGTVPDENPRFLRHCRKCNQDAYLREDMCLNEACAAWPCKCMLHFFVA